VAPVTATPATLHVVYDPLCGWCYAAAPLVEAARTVPGLQVALHGGGMMTGANRRLITPQWRDYVMPHDRRIAALSGQPFGAAYFDGLLRDTEAVMDSAPPTTAVLAAQAVAGKGLDMLHWLQRAHYVQGLRIADADVLRALAREIDLDAEFDQAMAQLAGAPTQAHMADSRQWLARAGGQGFPTFALQQGDAALVALDIGPWLGRPAPWGAHLQTLMALGATPSAADTQATACGPETRAH
jgi:putative protein-disulfide isomerase